MKETPLLDAVIQRQGPRNTEAPWSGGPATLGLAGRYDNGRRPGGQDAPLRSGTTEGQELVNVRPRNARVPKRAYLQACARTLHS